MTTQRHYHIMDRKDRKISLLARDQRNDYYWEYINRHENDIHLFFKNYLVVKLSLPG